MKELNNLPPLFVRQERKELNDLKQRIIDLVGINNEYGFYPEVKVTDHVRIDAAAVNLNKELWLRETATLQWYELCPTDIGYKYVVKALEDRLYEEDKMAS